VIKRLRLQRNMRWFHARLTFLIKQEPRCDKKSNGWINTVWKYLHFRFRLNPFTGSQNAVLKFLQGSKISVKYCCVITRYRHDIPQIIRRINWNEKFSIYWLGVSLITIASSGVAGTELRDQLVLKD